MSDNLFEDFLKILPENKKNTLDEEYYKIEDEFYELFGHRAPREIIPPGISEEQIKEAMELCVKNKKDTLLQFLNVKISENSLI